MKAVINDVSFQYKFATKNEAVLAYHQWLHICEQLNQKKVRRVQEIYGNSIDTSMEVAPDYKIIQLIQEFQDRDERRRLLGILLNSRNYSMKERNIYINEKYSEAASLAYEDGILISICSNAIFESEYVLGILEQAEISIDNISKESHIKSHCAKLGIRYYEHNEKHGKRPYIRSGGSIASEMDLSDEIAQKVLDEAIELKGHLYGYYNGSYYEFRRTLKNTYHGYKKIDLSKDMEKKIYNSIKEM